MRLPLELDITLQERVEQLSPAGNIICQSMMDILGKSGIDEEIEIVFAAAEFRMDKDPYSGEYAIEGKWKNPQQQCVGSIVFNADGTFFAEYDVIKDHPVKKRWFIEAVTAWGREDNVKSELRLLEKV